VIDRRLILVIIHHSLAYIQAGMPVWSGYLVLAVNVLVAHAALTGTDYAANLIKLYGFFGLLNAAVMFVSPKAGADMWKMKKYEAKTSKHDWNIKSAAISLMIHAAVVLLPSYGKTVMESFGWANAVLAASFSFLFFVTKDADKVGIVKGPMYFWLALWLIVAYTLLL